MWKYILCNASFFNVLIIFENNQSIVYASQFIPFCNSFDFVLINNICCCTSIVLLGIKGLNFKEKKLNSLILIFLIFISTSFFRIWEDYFRNQVVVRKFWTKHGWLHQIVIKSVTWSLINFLVNLWGTVYFIKVCDLFFYLFHYNLLL